MHEAIETMLSHYNCQTHNDYKNALKEIMQEVALLGLFRQQFFVGAAFYGGTALRIAHGLDRFSEDLDFTLNEPSPDFDISRYLVGIEDEFLHFGLKVTATKKQKTKQSAIDSAFLRANTLEYLLEIEGLETKTLGIHRDELLKIRLEVDTMPPMPMGEMETKYLTRPIPFSYRILQLRALFGGKLHAILGRNFPSGRVKGRDYYDFIWYIDQGITPDLEFLKGKLFASGLWSDKEALNLKALKDLLLKKFKQVDFADARRDVAPFIRDPRALEVWSQEFFGALVLRLE